MVKTIPFFENSSDNLRCLQACVRSLLSFYFPNKEFTLEEVDRRTLQFGTWSWLHPSALFLHDLGLTAELYSPFDYAAFGERGMEYLKDIWPAERIAYEEQHGGLKNLDLIQAAAKGAAEAGVLEKQAIGLEELRTRLEQPNTFAIGKTKYEWLAGLPVLPGTAHYVLLIKEYKPNTWRIHDPGYPGIENRKVPQTLGPMNILSDVLVIDGSIES